MPTSWTPNCLLAYSKTCCAVAASGSPNSSLIAPRTCASVAAGGDADVVLVAAVLVADTEEEEVALALSEEREVVESKVESERKLHEEYKRQAEDAMEGLKAFRADIEKLKREKEKMNTQLKTAEASIQIRESLDGVSLESNSQALANVRESIAKLETEAQISEELAQSGTTKLDQIKSKTSSQRAKEKLEALIGAIQSLDANIYTTNKTYRKNYKTCKKS